MISKKKLIKLIRKNYRGKRLSLKKLSESSKYSFEEFYPTAMLLENEGVVELRKIGEIGRDVPVDVEVLRFIPPQKKSLFQHPLVEKIIYFLLGVLIMLVANYIWDKLKK